MDDGMVVRTSCSCTYVGIGRISVEPEVGEEKEPDEKDENSPDGAHSMRDTTRSDLTRLKRTYDSYVEVKNRRRTHFHSHFHPCQVLLLHIRP